MEPLIQARNSSLPTFLSTSECVSNSNQLLFLFSHLESVWGAGDRYLTKSVTSVTKGGLNGESELARQISCMGRLFSSAEVALRQLLVRPPLRFFFFFFNVFLPFPTRPFSLRGKKEFCV